MACDLVGEGRDAGHGCATRPIRLSAALTTRPPPPLTTGGDPTQRSTLTDVIFITAKFRVRPEHAAQWPELTREFTEATRGEPGNLWFEWSRSLDDPTEYVLVEAFHDNDAGAAHVKSDHFATATATLPGFLVETPASSARRSTRSAGPSSARCASADAGTGNQTSTSSSRASIEDQERRSARSS